MKICSHCSKVYDKMLGVKIQRVDYGFCSVDCLSDSKPPCLGCGSKIVRNPKEKLYAFFKRIYCSQRCASTHATAFPRSDATKQRMSQARKDFYQTDYGQNVARNTGKKFSEFLKTDAGKLVSERNQAGLVKWRNSDSKKETYLRLTELKRTPEYRKKISEGHKQFFTTERGIELRQHYSALYKGIPRPPEVTAKMKQSLADFWNGEKGQLLAQQISDERTNGLPRARFGPNWKRQRIKAINRDNFICQVCGSIDFFPNVLPDVHHIYPRRVFGYIPKENQNYRWANHLDNLISLCASCHRSVEMKSKSIPETFQKVADILFSQFL